MSLINEMLKNLERRNGQTTGPYNIKSPADEESSLPLMIWIGVVVACIILLSTVGVHYYEKYRTKHKALIEQVTTPPTAITNTPPPVVTEKKAPIPAHAVTVSKMHINDLANQTSVVFDLDTTADFTTQADLTNHTETISIKKAWLDTDSLCQQLAEKSDCLTHNNIPLPVNTASIQSIHVDNNDGSILTLLFKLSNEAKLLSTQLKDNALTITFTNNASAQNNATDSSVIKTSQPLPIPSDLTTDMPSTDGSSILEPVNDIQKPLTIYDKIDTYILLKQYDKAEEAIHSLSEEEKSSTSGLLLQAKFQLALGNNTQALAILNKYPFNKNNPSSEFYALYAATLEFNGKHSEAVNIYKNLVKQSPENATWLLGFAIAALNDHQYALAKATFQTLTDIKDLNPEITSYAKQQIEKINIENQ